MEDRKFRPHIFPDFPGFPVVILMGISGPLGENREKLVGLSGLPPPWVSQALEKLVALLDLCVSPLRRGHANRPWVVPIVTDDPRRGSKHKSFLRGVVRAGIVISNITRSANQPSP